MKPDFVWLVHPLDEAQLQKWADEHGKTISQLVEEGPKVVDHIVDHTYNLQGIAISTPLLPRDLLGKRKVRAQLQLIKDMIDPTVPVGLGAWWATATRKGRLVREVLSNPIIDGYKGTIDRIIEQVQTHRDKGYTCVIGGGVVGTGVADGLLNHFNVDIYDKYKWKELSDQGYQAYPNDKLNLDMYDIGVCCTTATDDVVRVEDIPKGFKFIDDSYPHAIPDYEGRIDGGMYNEPTITSDWLVKDGKVYGCLYQLIEEARRKI